MKVREITEQTSSMQALVRHIKESVPLCDSIFRYQSEAYFDTFRKAKQPREAGSLPALDWESEEMLGTDIGESVEINGKTVWLDVPYLYENDEIEEAGRLRDIKIDHPKHKIIVKVSDDIPPGKMGSYTLFVNGKEIGKYDSFGRAKKALKTSLPEAEYNGKDVELNKPKRGGSKKYYVYVKNPKTGRVKKISFGDVTGLRTKSGNKKRAKSFAARHNCEKKNDKMKAGYWACRLPRYGLVKGGKWW